MTILLAHSLILSHQGIPLIYSGDEIASLNDQSYKKNPDKMLEGRWVHRPIFDWTRSEKRHTINTFEHSIFEGLKKMIGIRKSNNLFDGNVPVEIILNNDISIFSFKKQLNKKQMLFIHNFSEHIKYTSSDPYKEANTPRFMKDILTGRIIDFNHENIRLAPYEFLWLQHIDEEVTT